MDVTEMAEEITDTLEGIKLTKEGKVPIKEMDFVIEEERLEILTEKIKRDILEVLRNGVEDKKTTEFKEKETRENIIHERQMTRYALSVVEIVNLSKELEVIKKPLTKSKVYHHLPKLIENGFVIKFGETTTGKRKTDYYRRTSKVFFFSRLPGKDKKEEVESTEKYVDKILEVFKLNITPDEREELIHLHLETMELESEGFYKVTELTRKDIVNWDSFDAFQDLIRQYSFRSEKWIKARKRMTEILFKE